MVEKPKVVADKAATLPVPATAAARPAPSTAAVRVAAQPPQVVSEARYEYQNICRTSSSRNVAPEPVQPTIVKANTSPNILEKASGSKTPHPGVSRSVAAAAGPQTARQTQPRKLVSVVAPGGGTFANGAVYSDLSRSSRFRVEILGQARVEYDRYPERFDGGSPAPNLESFAGGLLQQGAVERSDCLVVGSRGGQVVLPHLWKTTGAATPPAIVINGGCAMKLPEAPCWPEEAVTFLLLGGRDPFRAKFSSEGYVADVKSRVPSGNSTTAVLYVNEMEHMPQSALLRATLHPAVGALLSWQESRQVPLEDFRLILASLTAGGFTGVLSYTSRQGEWKDLPFGAARAAPAAADVPPQRGSHGGA